MKLWKNSSSDNKSDYALEQIVEKFTVGQDYILDQVLIPFDIKASMAHAKGLHKIKILTTEELQTIEKGLYEILERLKNHDFFILPEDEDCHTAIEKFLTENYGEVGKKIHTGRSRNDQVLVAMRLYERERLETVFESTKNLTQVFIDFARKYEFIPMPGFTHTQRAMLSSIGMWAGSFAEQLIQNLESLKYALKLVNQCPLGSAAGFGVNFDLPRELVSKELGFDSPITIAGTAQNTRISIDVEVVHALSNVGKTLARFANDLIWFSSAEFKFFDINENLTTGSSIMPQKKNLDPAEIIRGEFSYLIGFEQTLQQLDRNLISGYHRELGRNKEAVFGSFDKISAMLEMSKELVKNITPNEEKLRAKCTPELFAADRANELVKEGASFRDAYLEVKELYTGDNTKLSPSVDIDKNLKSKKHLGATGNLGLEILEEKLETL